MESAQSASGHSLRMILERLTMTIDAAHGLTRAGNAFVAFSAVPATVESVAFMTILNF